MPLYVIATPIGNLGDITYRAVQTLSQADVVLAEDTRTSRVLLDHYDISAPMQSYHMHNEAQSLDKWIKMLQNEQSIALISDAGTPGISDPGHLIINTAIDEGIPVEILPGPTAFVPALLLSGMASHQFTFWGFPPQKKGLHTYLQELAQWSQTCVYYESPHRIIKNLKKLAELVEPDRAVSVSRELTKKFEETIRGNILEVILHLESGKVKGEFVICLEGTKAYNKRKKNERTT